jgi:predicted AlkP superfamily pyrophosphatase or phosphodiesterase
MRICALLLITAASLGAKQPLVVVSVDGLDNRYLANADQMGLKIPNIRRLVREGQASAGVIGAVPTITWPSHTTMITGVDPIVHGILGNWRPPGEKFLDYSQIKVPTLLGAAHNAGLKIATINWPVTVDAPVDWNIPEYFQRRRGGGMDRKSLETKTRPADLMERISADFPSFPQEFMDDRTRTLAVIWILQHQRPDLLLVHLVDLDSEEHDNAPFSREAKAIVEVTDEMLGQIMKAMPPDSAFALVSDHGFERVNTVVNLQIAAAAKGVTNLVQSGGTVTAPDSRSAAFLRELAKDAKYGIGREIPKAELAQFPSNIPADAAAVFEPADGFFFSPRGAEFSKPEEIGNHGHWPMRYRAVYVLWGPSIKHESLPEFSMREHAARFAKVLGIPMKVPGAN